MGVAITTSHFIADPTWLKVIGERLSQLPDASGIGGRIDPPTSSNLVDWATYFQRYSAYLHLGKEQQVQDLAGDNAAYRHCDLVRYPQFFDAGFWEPDFHKLVLAEGKKLIFVPDMAMRDGAELRVLVIRGAAVSPCDPIRASADARQGVGVAPARRLCIALNPAPVYDEDRQKSVARRALSRSVRRLIAGAGLLSVRLGDGGGVRISDGGRTLTPALSRSTGRGRDEEEQRSAMTQVAGQVSSS